MEIVWVWDQTKALMATIFRILTASREAQMDDALATRLKHLEERVDHLRGYL
jgi:hypothetical protein